MATARPYFCYLLVSCSGSCRRTYVGCTNDPRRRLRQHDGEISGGAKATRGRGRPWAMVCCVGGFRTQREALQFEWMWKRIKPHVGAAPRRIRQLHALTEKHKWTRRSPPALEVPLCVSVFPLGMPEDPTVASLGDDDGWENGRQVGPAERRLRAYETGILGAGWPPHVRVEAAAPGTVPGTDPAGTPPTA